MLPWDKNKEIELKDSLSLVCSVGDRTLNDCIIDLFERSITVFSSYTVNDVSFSVSSRLYYTFIGLFYRYCLNIEYSGEVNSQGIDIDIANWYGEIQTEFQFRKFTLQEKLYAYYKKYDIDQLLEGDGIQHSKVLRETEDKSKSQGTTTQKADTVSNTKSSSQNDTMNDDVKTYDLPYVNSSGTLTGNITEEEKQEKSVASQYVDNTSGSVNSTENFDNDITEDNTREVAESITITDTNKLKKWIEYNEKINDVISEFFNRYFRKFFLLVF